MSTDQNQTPQEELRIFFKRPESIKTAEGLKVDAETLSAVIPETAEVTLGKKNISVKHQGKGFFWGVDSINRVINERTKKQVW